MLGMVMCEGPLNWFIIGLGPMLRMYWIECGIGPFRFWIFLFGRGLIKKKEI